MSSTLIATHDPPPKGIRNPIHDDDGATSSGYAGALVAGVRTYGWAAMEIVAHLGDVWLDAGWADFSLRRPTFVDDELLVDATDGVVTVTCDRGLVLEGTYGLGDAKWLDELHPPAIAPGEEPPEVRPGYTLDDIPLHQPLRPLTVSVSHGAAGRLATEDLGIDLGRWNDRIHPYFLAARMAPLTRHNFTYGPTIHFRSQIQHRGPADAGQEVTVGAQIVDAYDRNAHWYQVLDGVVSGGAQQELARIRHHTIFRPRPKGEHT